MPALVTKWTTFVCQNHLSAYECKHFATAVSADDNVFECSGVYVNKQKRQQQTQQVLTVLLYNLILTILNMRDKCACAHSFACRSQNLACFLTIRLCICLSILICNFGCWFGEFATRTEWNRFKSNVIFNAKQISRYSHSVCIAPFSGSTINNEYCG